LILPFPFVEECFFPQARLISLVDFPLSQAQSAVSFLFVPFLPPSIDVAAVTNEMTHANLPAAIEWNIINVRNHSHIRVILGSNVQIEIEDGKVVG